MIIWNGKGFFTFLSVVIGGLSLAVLQPLIPALQTVGAAYVFAAAAGLNYLFLRVIPFTKEHEPRTFVDQQTGQTIQVTDEGSLFFIRRRYWTYILLGLSIIFLFMGLFSN